ncbi:hypothetical protein ACHAWF_013686 [Thalassiosira exigua]
MSMLPTTTIAPILLAAALLRSAGPAAAFVAPHSTVGTVASRSLLAVAPVDDDRGCERRAADGAEREGDDGSPSSPSSPSPRRRGLLSSAASAASGACCCWLCGPRAARPLAEIEAPPPDLVREYDRPRSAARDELFGCSMATTMGEYEAWARPRKEELFRDLFGAMARGGRAGSGDEPPTVVELGMGTFPNAPYYARALEVHGASLAGLDVVGVDPNDAMFEYAKGAAERSGLVSSSSSSSSLASLRMAHGVAEALPFATGSVDAVVSTLTLCSVADPARALSEVARVLRPGSGRFLFWEHVLSEDDGGLALQQRALSPLQSVVADGCHLDRRTGKAIRDAGFPGGVAMEYTVLDDGGIIGPTVLGIASA